MKIFSYSILFSSSSSSFCSAGENPVNFLSFIRLTILSIFGYAYIYSFLVVLSFSYLLVISSLGSRYCSDSFRISKAFLLLSFACLFIPPFCFLNISIVLLLSSFAVLLLIIFPSHLIQYSPLIGTQFSMIFSCWGCITLVLPSSLTSIWHLTSYSFC